MSLSAGTRFGPYEILAPLGQGGMSARGSREARSRRARASGGGAPRALKKVRGDLVLWPW